MFNLEIIVESTFCISGQPGKKVTIADWENETKVSIPPYVLKPLIKALEAADALHTFADAEFPEED